jgi:acyl-CoA reductase-like NAD-dependent aldehyde dehydrogenase
MAPTVDFTRFHNIIAGKTRDATKHTSGVDPATKEKLWPVPVAIGEDVEDAVTSSNRAFTSWSTTTAGQRKTMLASFKTLYSQYLDEFTQLLMRETGKPKATAEGEVHGVLELFDHHLGLELPEERIEDEEKVITTRYVPLGVVAAICPWNFPIFLSIGKMIPAILTGCCIIMKPSPFTPYTALKVAELAQRVFPPGVVQALGGEDMIGPALVSHPNIHKISFTGSVATGKKVMGSAAATLKRVTLEL